MIRAMSRLLTKSGTDGKAGLSRPSNVACTVELEGPLATPLSTPVNWIGALPVTDAPS